MSRSVSAPSSVTKTSPCWNGLIVPGSTLMYGSNFWTCTFRPRALSSRPSAAAVMPLPSDETTPPVTNTYLVGRAATPSKTTSGPGSRRGRGLTEVVEATDGLFRQPVLACQDAAPPRPVEVDGRPRSAGAGVVERDPRLHPEPAVEPAELVAGDDAPELERDVPDWAADD